MRIIFIRHGETDTNLKERAGEGAIEDDASLNSTGLEQAKMVAKQLKNEKIDAIFTSPYKRATETANEIRKYHRVPMLELENLRERNVGIAVGDYFHELFDFDKDIRAENIKSVRDFFKEFTMRLAKLKNPAMKI